MSPVTAQIVFPQPHYPPAIPAQSSSDGAIAESIVLNLVAPIVGILLRHSTTLGAAMPEAAIDENHQLTIRKDEIRLA